MQNTRTFDFDGGGYYTVTIDDSEVKLDGYTLGSPAGGTGTECSHTIDATKRAEFFAEMGVASGEGLFLLLDAYRVGDWVNLHSVITKYETDSFVWVETDWSDSINVTITLTGEAKVGSVLTAVATAISSEGTFPIRYKWYINDELEGTYRVIELAVDEVYTIAESDRGKFIRVSASASDAVGFNSSSNLSKSVGPVE